jgi:UDP-glucose 4-epimerase
MTTTCLVTGGAGFIGSHLVEALVAEGHTVTVLDNLSTGSLENLAAVSDRVKFVQGDVRDETAVQQAAAGVELIFHLAAMVSVPQSMADPVEAEVINTVGTLNVLQAARAAGSRRMVLSSTCAVYGDEPTLPKKELMIPQPNSPYAISKLAAELYCGLFYEAFGLETVVLRYFNVFGPRQDPSSPYSGVVSIFVNRLSRGQQPAIFGDGEQTRDFVYVGDVVRANLLAALTPAAARQTFNIGTGRPVSINRLFRALSRILNQPIEPDYQPPRQGDIIHSYGDAARAGSTLNWTAQVSLEEGLERLVASLQ